MNRRPRDSQLPVKLSELYHKYHTNLKESRATYEAHLGELAEKLDDEWEVCLKKNMFSTSPYFDSAAARIEISKSIRDFIQSSETNVPFVAIDGSSHKEQGDRFISIYGGAYCVRGELRVQGRDARISYFRHLEKEVSYVAFIPVPPEASLSLTDEAAEAEASNLLPGSDKDSFELTSMHNKIMQLAEIYAAYDLARSELEPPKLVLLDNSLSSWLVNTSFEGLYQSLIGKDFDGIKIDLADIYTTLSKPSNPSLGVPPKSTWAPHYRIIAEFAWRGKRELPVDELVRSMGSEELVNTGLKALSIYNLFEVSSGSIKLGWDPSVSWSKMEQLFNQISRKLFGEVKSTGLICKSATGRDVYLSPRELQFITGIGLRLLVETCWR